MAINKEYNDDYTENEDYERRRDEEREKRTKELQDELTKLEESQDKIKIKRWDRSSDYIKFLDQYIDMIEEMFFKADSIKKISRSFGVPEYKLFLWSKNSVFKARIAIALEYQSETRMGMTEEILEKYLNDPKLTMQQTSLARELALHHSRMAGFRAPRTFGKDSSAGNTPPQINIVSGDDMTRFIQAALVQKQLEKADEEPINESEDVKEN